MDIGIERAGAARYRFGHVEVRPDERALLVGGERAPVGARAFDVLVVLIERRDRVVSKDELLRLAWRGVIVEENNLQAQVCCLRKLVGRDALATVSGWGYRFTAALDDGGDAPPSEVPGVPDPPARLIERELSELRALVGNAIGIVRDLDGTRLAIEAAGAHAPFVGLQLLLARLAEGLDVLTPLPATAQVRSRGRASVSLQSVARLASEK